MLQNPDHIHHTGYMAMNWAARPRTGVGSEQVCREHV